MRYALTFIFGVVLCFLVDIHEAYSEPYNAADLRTVSMLMNLEENTGMMAMGWQGFAPLEEYESRWLDLNVVDTISNSSVSLQFWIKTWYGVCAPPCALEAEVILRNVDWVTQ